MKITWTTLMDSPSQVEPRPAGERLVTARSSLSETPMTFDS